MSTLKTVDMGMRQRFGQMDNLLYMTDGLHQPKSYDGTSLMNWGITSPSAQTSVSPSSVGATVVDDCESSWTPSGVVLFDCESIFTINSGITNAVSIPSADAKAGVLSSTILLGYASEPVSNKTAVMLHCDGTNGAVSMADDSQCHQVPAFFGTAALTTTSPVFGTAALQLLDRSNDRVNIPTMSGFNIGTGDFTLDWRYRLDTLNVAGDSPFIFSLNRDSTGWISINQTGNTTFTIEFVAGQSFDRSFTTTVGVWYHFRLVRASGVVYFFIDGVRQGATFNNTTNITGGITGFNIGRYSGTLGGSKSVLASFDEIRLDVGSAMSTSNFIVPPVAYGSFTAPTTTPLGIYGLVAYKDITPVDLSGYYGVKFWVKSLRALPQVADVSLGLYDSAGGLALMEKVDMPILQPDNWTEITYQFAAPALLTSIASIGISVNRDSGQNALYFDDIQAIRCRAVLETDPDYVSQGFGAVRLEIPANIPSGTLLAYRNITSVDMHTDVSMLASVRCSKETGTQTFQYLLDNTADCASPLESIYFPDLLAADMYHNIALTFATPANLTAVISHGIKLNNRNIGDCTLWVDDFKRSTAAVPGNLTGRYYVWVSYYNSKYDKESDLSPISGVADCVGQTLSLTSIPVSVDAQVDGRRIYRSAAGGTVPYLDSTINDNTTTTLSLTKSDASLLAAVRHPSLAAGAGKFAPPPAAPYMVQSKSRFLMAGSGKYTRGTVTATNASATFTFTTAQLDDSFIGRYLQIIGDTTNYVIISVNAGACTCVARPIYNLTTGAYVGVTGGGKAYYITDGSSNTVFTSYVDDNDTPRPHGFPIEFAQDIVDGGDNDIISGLGLIGNLVVVTKYQSTHIFEGDYPPFSVAKVSSTVGCISHDTICQDEAGNAIWLAGEQGVAYCNGSVVSIISQKIEDIFTAGHSLSLNVGRFAFAHSVYDTKNKLYYLFCSSAASSVNDVCLVLDKSRGDNPDTWAWYYFTGIEASSSTIVYSSTGVGTITIGDYDGFTYELNTGWYDGVSAGTLSGTATSVAGSVLNDTGAAFYTTGSGLRNIPLLVYKVSTGETWVYKIASNTGTSITITGAFTESPSTSDYRYYVGGYEINWKSKQFELMRPTDKKLLMDAVLNNYILSASQKMRIQILKNLGATQIANQLRDLSEGEEQVMLVRERVSQAQWQISGFVHGQNVQIVSLGLRLRGRGIK